MFLWVVSNRGQELDVIRNHFGCPVLKIQGEVSLSRVPRWIYWLFLGRGKEEEELGSLCPFSVALSHQEDDLILDSQTTFHQAGTPEANIVLLHTASGPASRFCCF